MFWKECWWGFRLFWWFGCCGWFWLGVVGFCVGVLGWCGWSLVVDVWGFVLVWWRKVCWVWMWYWWLVLVGVGCGYLVVVWGLVRRIVCFLGYFIWLVYWSVLVVFFVWCCGGFGRICVVWLGVGGRFCCWIIVVFVIVLFGWYVGWLIVLVVVGGGIGLGWWLGNWCVGLVVGFLILCWYRFSWICVGGWLVGLCGFCWILVCDRVCFWLGLCWICLVVLLLCCGVFCCSVCWMDFGKLGLGRWRLVCVVLGVVVG